ncbi:hypothetical protein DL771_009478 [Monosporascus sp. 5C6A]|nr:hypothetical protein DL771_009478 [Monosporascus sp. 5C6A]
MMGQKREGPPLVKQEDGPKRIKSEKFEETKIDLRSIPRAPTTAFKVKEEADSKPKFNMTGPTKNGSAQKSSSGSSKRPPKSRRHYNSPQVVKVYLDSSHNRGISGHYDRGREKVFLRGHGDFDWNSDLFSVVRVFDRLSSVNLNVIPASMPILVRPSQAPAVTAMLAPAASQLHQSRLLFKPVQEGSTSGTRSTDTLPSGVTIKVDEKDK